MPTHIIRKAEARDMVTVFTLVKALLKELGEEGDEAGELDTGRLSSLHHELAGRHVVFLALADAGPPVGVLTLCEVFAIYANGCYGVINEMYVAPDHRGLGLGGKLLHEAERHGRLLGWRRIDVAAPEARRRQRTRRFYERRGFVFTGPKLKLLL